METNLANEELIREAYESWRKHPTTSLLIQAIERHKAKFVTFLSHHSSDNNVSDAQFRSHAAGLKAADAMLAIITDYDKFIEQLKKT